MSRSLQTLVLALLATLTTASGAAAFAPKTALRAHHDFSPRRVGLLAQQLREVHWQNSLEYGELASDASLASRAAPEVAEAFGGLSRAAEFGVKPYGQLRSALQGTGLQAHHLIEQRFAGVMGQSARQMLSVAVTPAEHQAFTNAWRAAIPYGQGTANATAEQVLNAARQIYSSHPEILQTLGL